MDVKLTYLVPPMKPSFLPYAHQSIDTSDIKAVTKALKGGNITRGELTEQFENEVAQYCGAQYAVAFNSCSSALQAAYHVADTGPNDRILSSPNTFVSSVGSGVQHGASPVFLDIDPQSGNMDLENLPKNLEYRSTRGKNIIAPVHFAGISVDMKAMEEMINDPSVVIIEDAAHAFGSQYPGSKKRVGSCEWSHMTVFSFHPAKTITTGEGGMVTTNDQDHYNKLKRFRNNGIEKNPSHLAIQASPWYYEVQELSGNYHLTEFQAALGLSQLSRLEDFITKRRHLVETYRKRLDRNQLITLFAPSADSITAYHLFVVQIDFAACGTTREEVMNKLQEDGIGTQVHYIPLYSHPYFKKHCGDIADYFPNMERYYSQALSLPLFQGMEESDVERVAASLEKILN